MHYRDLVQFEPIESVIQLLDANRPTEAVKLVSSYVISDDMAERIAKQIVPQLGFDESVDHKGLLVVGNYGTGKSHLMSVLSLIAENASYLQHLHSEKVAESAKPIAGRFKVHRIEISSQMSLRDIITKELEQFLAGLGIEYSFPPADEVVNNKTAFEAMMEAFNEKFPNQGVLLVVDEFLEFLRSRNDHNLVLDLSFLREIGEVTRHLRFRFIGGVQESIFDSGRFQHVSDSLKRVKDRFSQVWLVRQDVSYVVEKRLLKKSADQHQKIRDYLTPFAKFYDGMNEKMDDFVRLFPVHPEYIATFEHLVFTEKRGALVTIRDQIGKILDNKVPADRPGLICYDKFWDTVVSNSVLRADPNIGPVLKVSDVLTERVQKAFTRPSYKPMALRIVNALSTNRLTTGGDIYVPVGQTAKELRDSLCLYQPGIEDLGGDPADDLLTAVQTTLREIVKTVNGQFISKAPEKEEYYLDLKKDIDYDAQIEKRSEHLSNDALDRAYYGAIKQLMERTDEHTYVTGYQIWQYPIEWQEHHVHRDGYLFFGAPNDRPTAQPERDFYIYFIQPFDPPTFKNENKPDEVFFRMARPDDAFKLSLSLYAAAQELASTAAGGAKAIYLDKATKFLRDISKWLQEKQMNAFEVTYQGKSKALQDWVKGVSIRDKAHLGPDDRANFRDVVNVVSGLVLGSRFQDVAPEYPTFSALVTDDNRRQLVVNALKLLSGGPRTKDAVVILDALEMLDGDRINPAHSRYATEVLRRLKLKGQGQVLNRSELISGSGDIEFFDPGRYRLEPDLLVAVLACLVYSGDIVLSITGDKIDSSKLSVFTERPFDDLKLFKHIEAPKEINISVLRALFEFFELPPGLAQKVTQGDEESVRSLLEASTKLVHRALSAGVDLKDRLVFWGRPLLSESEYGDYNNRLVSLKNFAEGLQPYNTIGKLKNLRTDALEISRQAENYQILKTVENLLEFVSDVGATAAYLSQAELVLPTDHPWLAQAQTVKNSIGEQLSVDRNLKKAPDYKQQLVKLKKDYLTAYIALHTKARLGVSEEKSKTQLSKDTRLVAMRALASISCMHTSQLTGFEDKLNGLKSCASLIDADLQTAPCCPHCGFNPRNEQAELIPAASVLRNLDDELEKLLNGWQQTLLDNLGDPTIAEDLKLVSSSARSLIQSFLKSKKLPDPVAPEFVAAVQEALSGLEGVSLTSADIRTALLNGGSPAKPDDLRKRFDNFIADRCKGKDSNKLRFVVD